MLVIGVTGGVGTGKSTVSKMLASLGAEIIDADRIVHQVILPGGPAYSGLVQAFGDEILDPDGTINRRRLGQLAFGDTQGAVLLNGIVHPPVIEVIRARLADLAASGVAAAVLDVPLLFESGLDKLCDQVWVVDTSPAVRQQRVEARNGPAAAEVIERESLQMSMQEKIARADAVIDNSGSLAASLEQVTRLWSHRSA
jgi:dephospho-CoA kinase